MADVGRRGSGRGEERAVGRGRPCEGPATDAEEWGRGDVGGRGRGAGSLPAGDRGGGPPAPAPRVTGNEPRRFFRRGERGAMCAAGGVDIIRVGLVGK